MATATATEVKSNGKEWEEANRESEFQIPGQKREEAAKPAGLAIKDYWSPFDDYPNFEIDANWSQDVLSHIGKGFGPDGMDPQEWAESRKGGLPHKHGLEIEHSAGYIKVTEEQPIVAVSVLGSGCSTNSYIICEYPQPGLTGKEPSRHGEKGWNLQNLRRQYVRGLHSTHQSRSVGTFGEDELHYTYDCEPRCYECSVRFDVEPTTTVILRAGSGTLSHFSFRMIRVYFTV